MLSMFKKKDKKYSVPHSFKTEFVSLIEKLYKELGEEVFQIQGIANKHMDIVQFTNDFFANSASAVADKTVDPNANNFDRSVLQYNYSNNKALMRLNSLYILWYAIEKMYDKQSADKSICNILCGKIFVNDLHSILQPYSYYGKTSIIVRVNGQIKYVTMENLFQMYSDKVDILPDREQIDFDKIFYTNTDYVKNNIRLIRGSVDRYELKKKRPSIKADVVTEKQIVEILDNGHWVKLKRLLRHKRDTDMVMYQTKSGRVSFVTENHPVILDDKTEVSAGSLKIGDKVICINDIPETQRTISVDKDLAYLCGFMLGDGNTPRHKFYKKGNTNLGDKNLCIAHDKVRSVNIVYQKNIKNSKIYRVLVNLFGEKNINVKENRVLFTSLEFNILYKKYFGTIDSDNSFNHCLPVNILSWDEGSIDQLICGLIDSEGSICRSNSVNIRMRAMAVIQQLQLLLERKGIHAGINFYRDINCWGIIFPIFDGIAKGSEKILSTEIKPYKEQYDVRDKQSNEISKIIRSIDSEDWNSYSENHLEWVYDVTTETGTFTSGMMTQHNCWAFDLDTLVREGMTFFHGSMKIGAPKRSSSFIALVIQATAYISNQITGAIAYPTFFLHLNYYY